MTLIGLGFTARVGKTYASSLLKAAYPDRTVVVLAFADAVKEGLRPVLEGSGIDPFTEDPEQKKILRPLLVAYGELWRAVDPDHWVKVVMDRVGSIRGIAGLLRDLNIRHHPSDPLVVISDVRYPNECRAIHDRSGVVVNIQADVEPANEVERRNALLCAGMADAAVFNDFTPAFGLRLLAALAPWLPGRSLAVPRVPATGRLITPEEVTTIEDEL